jgi:NitT/TauT family transport system permease protein
MPEKAPSVQRLAYLRAGKRRTVSIHVLQVSLLIFSLGLWELAARLGWVDAFIVSSPSRVAATFLSLNRSGDLWLHVGTSCLETVVGFLLGTVLGTLIAVALWWSDFVSRILDPYLVVLNALPKTALGPIFIVWIGAGTGSIIAMTLAISIIVTILNMHVGFLSTDENKIRLMRTLGAGRGQILRMLVFPSNYATLFNTLKVNVGLSWVGVIMGEFLVSKAGLGYLIVYGSQVFNMDLVMTTVFILAIAAVVMYQGVLWLEKLLEKRLGVIV